MSSRGAEKASATFNQTMTEAEWNIKPVIVNRELTRYTHLVSQRIQPRLLSGCGAYDNLLCKIQYIVCVPRAEI